MPPLNGARQSPTIFPHDVDPRSVYQLEEQFHFCFPRLTLMNARTAAQMGVYIEAVSPLSSC